MHIICYMPFWMLCLYADGCVSLALWKEKPLAQCCPRLLLEASGQGVGMYVESGFGFLSYDSCVANWQACSLKWSVGQGDAWASRWRLYSCGCIIAAASFWQEGKSNCSGCYAG